MIYHNKGNKLSVSVTASALRSSLGKYKLWGSGAYKEPAAVSPPPSPALPEEDAEDEEMLEEES